MVRESDMVRLVRPTDFLILSALKEHGRNVAPNLAEHTGKTRDNINNRLPQLEDYGLVRKIGPAEASGLYELTERGRVALENRERYEEVDDFGQLIEQELPS